MKETTVKKIAECSSFAVVIVLALFVAGCATTGPGGAPSGPVVEGRPVESPTYFSLGPDDQTYVLMVEDRTPLGIFDLPMVRDVLYTKGYDEVRRQRDADFTVNVLLVPGIRDNPDVRAGQALGGALIGAAMGAIIGGTVGDPGPGAAIGAASGGALGLVAPASDAVVRIELTFVSFDGIQIGRGAKTVTVSGIPPYQVVQVIDNEVSGMLQALPPR